MRKIILGRLGIVGVLGILGFFGGGGSLASKAYAACYFYHGLKSCSNTSQIVVYADPPPAGVGLSCRPSTGQCWDGAGRPTTPLTFTGCVPSSGNYESLWTGCTAGSVPTSTPPPASPTATSVPPTDVPTATPGDTPTSTPPTGEPTSTLAPGTLKPVVVELCSEPTTQPTNTPIPTTCPTNGDYNGDGRPDILDYEEWQADFLAGNAALACFEYWRRAAFAFGAPTATPTTAPTAEPAEGPQPSSTPTPTTTPTPRDSVSYAIRFAGRLANPDYIRVEDSSTLKAKPEMTVEGWIKIMGENTEEVPRYQTFISKKNQHIPQLPYWLLVDGERKLRYGACWAWEPVEDCIVHSDNQGQTALEKK